MIDSTQSTGLTSEQLDFWERNGYLIIPDALPPPVVSSLLAETRELLSNFDISSHPMTKFSTGGKDGKDHVGDGYFLTSGNKICFFFEEDAFTASGELLKPKEMSINKIGHCLHELSPSFKEISLNSRNYAIARSLGFKDPRCLQSMVICKQPEIGGAVPPHQDSTFLYTNPPSAVGFWYALEDATASNGCLSFVAGSHKRAPVLKRFVRSENGQATTFVDNTGPQFPSATRFMDEEENSPGEYTVGEVKAGTLVLIHGNLLHKSEKNLSGKSRFIYTFHIIEGENEYDGRNWLQPPNDGFSKLLS
ncbi:uncharacterized protein PV09_09619 [Verruconis gallopava]|uniref:Fe2OG dioxygenase domain-containing protein n=1 Tax=Verruconis gallopava TaxID=253628 RepID=A0A0D1X935_9PEZI|nr:uncharacterized protein PV09_09619 [Verruconis gallopava]KIV98585.1 hypothetical protein PV09_09619 [Verruconis gallopava]